MPERNQPKADAPPYCVSISWLAQKLGVNRKTLTAQLKKPGSPPPILVGSRQKWRVTDLSQLFPGLVIAQSQQPQPV